MRDWYKAGDKKLESLNKESARIFRKSRLTLDFDNINQPVKTIQSEAKRVYRKLKKKSDKAYLDIGLLVYMEAFEEAVAAEAKPKKTKDAEPEVGLPVAEISQKSKKAITEKWLEKFHREYNPVTKYVYENELERKQARFFEAIVADVEAKDRHGMEADYKTAENAWKRQTRQAMIDTEDRVTLTAYKDAGTGEVMWVSVCDNRTCEECGALNGLIFPIDSVPDKPHYNCRCHIVPVKRSPQNTTAEHARLQRSYSNAVSVRALDAPGFTGKFDSITQNEAVNRTIYNSAVEMLTHRNGTNGEDLYLIDGNTGEVIHALVSSNGRNSVTYDDAILDAIQKAHKDGRNIIALHNHPNGLPPTLDDGVSACARGYDLGVVVGHNMEVYTYSPTSHVYTSEECQQIHGLINESIALDVDFDENAWYNILENSGMEVRRIMNG